VQGAGCHWFASEVGPAVPADPPLPGHGYGPRLISLGFRVTRAKPGRIASSRTAAIEAISRKQSPRRVAPTAFSRRGRVSDKRAHTAVSIVTIS
ncbi:MAG: hypothetical protein WED34_21565, partial [Planctomycetales bacterium]